MLTFHSYVFILGAGAGKPYGFPLGDELYEFICNQLRPGFNDEDKDENAQYFSKELRQTHGISIDRYLNINKRLKNIGVLLVAAAIHFFESKSIDKLPFNNFFLQGDWYTYLYKKMIQGLETPEELLRISENKVSFVTFNYDRSLEHYLFSNLYGLLKNAGVKEEVIAAKLAEIPIIHVYGNTGYLPWEKHPSDLPYAIYGDHRTTPGRMALRTHEMINLIYDERKDSPELEKAKELIQKTDRIIFLGFGYDEINLSILGLPDLLKGKTVLGTAFNSTENERDQIETKLGLGRVLNECNIINCDCLTLLRDHLN
jgi:hypothetical protein